MESLVLLGISINVSSNKNGMERRDWLFISILFGLLKFLWLFYCLFFVYDFSILTSSPFIVWPSPIFSHFILLLQFLYFSQFSTHKSAYMCLRMSMGYHVPSLSCYQFSSFSSFFYLNGWKKVFRRILATCKQNQSYTVSCILWTISSCFFFQFYFVLVDSVQFVQRQKEERWFWKAWRKLSGMSCQCWIICWKIGKCS